MQAGEPVSPPRKACIVRIRPDIRKERPHRRDAEDAEINELFSNRETAIGEERANLSGPRLGALFLLLTFAIGLDLS